MINGLLGSAKSWCAQLRQRHETIFMMMICKASLSFTKHHLILQLYFPYSLRYPIIFKDGIILSMMLLYFITQRSRSFIPLTRTTFNPNIIVILLLFGCIRSFHSFQIILQFVVVITGLLVWSDFLDIGATGIWVVFSELN